MLKPFMDEGERFVLFLQREYVYHGKVMVQGRDSECGAFSHIPELDQVPVIAADEILLHLFVEPHGPGKGFRVRSNLLYREIVSSPRK